MHAQSAQVNWWCSPGYHHSGSMATRVLETHGVRFPSQVQVDNRTPCVRSIAMEPLW